MAKIITVQGSPGRGKSMFYCILARVPTAGRRKAIVINADPTTPMLPVWTPDRILEQDAPVGSVLSSPDVNSALITERVAVLKDYPFIGIMEYAAGETPFSYPGLKYDRAKLLISEASRLIGFITLDCSSSVVNLFTPTAIESVDIVVRILTSDLKSINYLKAHKPFLTDAEFRYDEHLTFARLARPFRVLDEMGHLVGGFDGILPYTKEIGRCGASGEMFRVLAYCNQRYINSMKLVRQRLGIGEASQEADAVQEEEILSEWPE